MNAILHSFAHYSLSLHGELHLCRCLYKVVQSISSIISSMLTAPMMDLKNSSVTALALMNLSWKRTLFSSATLTWYPLYIILVCSPRICWVPHWSPWMYFTHRRPGRSGRENGRKISLLLTAHSQTPLFQYIHFCPSPN